MNDNNSENVSEDLAKAIAAANNTTSRNKKAPRPPRRAPRDYVPSKRLKRAHRAQGGNRSLKQFAREEAKGTGYHKAEAQDWLKIKTTKQPRSKKAKISYKKSSD